MADKFYITTAIDYSNGEPHLGHAFEKIGADCIARYRRLRGQKVFFVIGMDEHGQKVAQTAEEQGVDPQDWVDGLAAKFEAAWRELDISNTDFIRTTEERHKVDKGTYSGFYCVGCEAFKLEKDLEDGKCPQHPTREVKWVEEPNLFFKAGAFRDYLLQLYESRPEASDFVRPKAKLNEVRNVVAEWDHEYAMSASRASVRWGIPWPGDASHTVYVWFEALINYLSATGFPDDGFEEIWPADLHVIGPDILRFHAAFWPAMLKAAGLAVPGGVWCHGWVKTSDSRFSKSAGVTITLREAIDRHGSDALRYFLLREVPWDADGNFTWARFDARYTSELADGYGNLASRILAMITRYLEGVVPEGKAETELDRAGVDALAEYQSAMDAHLLHEGGNAAWRLVARANQFVEESAPWTLAKAQKTEQLRTVMAALARALNRITVMASPFVPGKAQAVWQALGNTDDVSLQSWQDLESPKVAGRSVTKLAPLFPKPQV